MKRDFYGEILTLNPPNTETVANDRPRRSNGSYTSQYEPRDFIKAIKQTKDPTTSNIADTVGCGVGTAHRYLTQLAENGELHREEKYGAVVWSIPQSTSK